MQAIFTVATHGFQNQAKENLTGSGKEKKANATEDDEQARERLIAVEKHGDQRHNVSRHAGHGNSTRLSAAGEKALWRGQSVFCGNESPGDAGKKQKGYVGSPIGFGGRRREEGSVEAQVSGDAESACRQKKHNELQNEFHQI
jgi:hypothetical protein